MTKKNGKGGKQQVKKFQKLQMKQQEKQAASERLSLARAEELATRGATDEELAAAAGAPPIGIDSVDDAVEKAQTILAILAEREKTIASRERRLDERQNELDAGMVAHEGAKASLAAKEKELRESLEKVRADSEAMRRREAELQEKEEGVLLREADAEGGFAALRQRVLDGLGESVQSSRAMLDESLNRQLRETAEIERKRSEALAELARDLDGIRDECARKLEAELAGKRRELDERWEAVEKRRADTEMRIRALRQKETEIAAKEEIVKEDEACVKERARMLAMAEVARLEGELEAERRRYKVAQNRRQELEEQAEARAELDRQSGHRDLGSVLKELNELRGECGRLRDELRTRLSASDGERLVTLEREAEQWKEERGQLVRDRDAWEARARRTEIGVIKVETLRDTASALEAQNRELQRVLSELRRDVEHGVGDQPTFEACSRMDNDEGLQVSPPTRSQFGALAGLAKEIRLGMAIASSGWDPLYYSDRDVRSFIGGLASSRLLLLEGISGTGKTSLPCRVASMTQGGVKAIEVQAGWHDRDDLLGFYNSFERRYRETPFVNAIYEAQTPAYRDRLYFIVLDEMNLSHPEQYFADMLSVMERPEGEDRSLALLSVPAARPPRLMGDGRILRIPNNVWFIGTANQDETTKDFAPKTRDRAHVMQLPRRPAVFSGRRVAPAAAPLSYAALAAAFAEAQERGAAYAKDALGALGEVEESLRRSFGIGWGNRLERQLRAFVPVVVECGGSVAEALDDVLSTKVLRPLTRRHDVESCDIEKLQKELEAAFAQVGGGLGDESRALTLLEELRTGEAAAAGVGA